MKNRNGFSWWELLLLVLITAVFTGLTIPKFKDLIVRSKEGGTKGGLSEMRSALSSYYLDNKNSFPTDTLESLTKGKYLYEIPITQLPKTGHPDSNKVYPAGEVTDEGGWIYFNDKSDLSKWGHVIVNCSHYDVKKELVWSEL